MLLKPKFSKESDVAELRDFLDKLEAAQNDSNGNGWEAGNDD